MNHHDCGSTCVPVAACMYLSQSWITMIKATSGRNAGLLDPDGLECQSQADGGDAAHLTVPRSMAADSRRPAFMNLREPEPHRYGSEGLRRQVDVQMNSSLFVLPRLLLSHDAGI